MNSRGFSLVELIVVISITAILLSIATLNFSAWMKKYQTEAQTRELYADLSQFRLNAIHQKKRSAVFLGPTSYVFRTYSSSFEPIASGTFVSRKTFDYETRKGTSLDVLNISSDFIEFNNRGFTNNTMILVVLPVQYNAGENCILVSEGRTKIGRMINATTCQPR